MSASVSETTRGVLSRSLFLLYFLQVGLVLLVAPWTLYWDRNLFVAAIPFLENLLTAHVVRGAVSGIGLLSLGAALAELARSSGRVGSSTGVQLLRRKLLARSSGRVGSSTGVQLLRRKLLARPSGRVGSSTGVQLLRRKLLGVLRGRTRPW